LHDLHLRRRGRERRRRDVHLVDAPLAGRPRRDALNAPIEQGEQGLALPRRGCRASRCGHATLARGPPPPLGRGSRRPCSPHPPPAPASGRGRPCRELRTTRRIDTARRREVVSATMRGALSLLVPCFVFALG